MVDERPKPNEPVFMYPPSDVEELWRLRKGSDLLVCTVARGTDGTALLEMRHNNEVLLSACHITSLTVAQRANLLRWQFLADGWMGVVERNAGW